MNSHVVRNKKTRRYHVKRTYPLSFCAELMSFEKSSNTATIEKTLTARDRDTRAVKWALKNCSARIDISVIIDSVTKENVRSNINLNLQMKIHKFRLHTICRDFGVILEYSCAVLLVKTSNKCLRSRDVNIARDISLDGLHFLPSIYMPSVTRSLERCLTPSSNDYAQQFTNHKNP